MYSEETQFLLFFTPVRSDTKFFMIIHLKHILGYGKGFAFQ